MQTAQHKRPRGFMPIGFFFVFGATMAAYAAITLLRPGTVLDGLWTLNKTGHTQLASLGKVAGLDFAALSILLGAAALGWFRRRYWGWLLGTTIIAINAGGDLLNAFRGEWWQGAIGVAIAGLLLFYMTTRDVRNYLNEKTL